MCIADGGCACALLIRLTCAGYTSLRSVAAAQSASRTLRILDASHNTLVNGSLPSIFGKLPELRSLRLADCNFSGSIPGARRHTLGRLQPCTPCHTLHHTLHAVRGAPLERARLERCQIRAQGVLRKPYAPRQR